MKANRAIPLFLLLSVCLAPAMTRAQGDGGSIHLTLPSLDWRTVLDLPGFVVEAKEIQEDGRRYLLATHPKNGLIVSVFLEQVSGSADTGECSRLLKQRTEDPSYELENIELSEEGSRVRLAYLLPELEGFEVDQQNIFVCIPQEDVYVDLHLSKMDSAGEELALFDAVIESLRFEPLAQDEGTDTSVDGQSLVEREYHIGNDQVFHLRFPGSWDERYDNPGGNGFPTVTLGSPSGDEFVLLASFLQMPAGRHLDAESVRSMAEAARDMIQPSAVEKELVLNEFQGTKGMGYYFSATDKAPAPGEFEYLTAGVVPVGDVLVQFTFLYHEKDSPAWMPVLAMLREARLQP